MGKTFDDLLDQMPSIAKAVNAFEGEEAQRRALDALLDAFGSETRPASKEKKSEGDKSRKKRTRSKKKSDDEGQSEKTKLSATPSPVKDLDFNPSGATSFADFLDEKEPSNNNERNVVAVYWMKEIAGRDAVTRDDVYTCYRLTDSWKIPADMNNSLHKTASQENWLDTSDMADITLTPQGMNAVEHDLPRS